MNDGGQSGYICPTPRCPRSWYGTLSEAEWDEKHLTPDERERAQRSRAIWRSTQEWGGDGFWVRVLPVAPDGGRYMLSRDGRWWAMYPRDSCPVEIAMRLGACPS